MQRWLSKCRCPLTHRYFWWTGTYHQNNKNPKRFCFNKFKHCHALAICNKWFYWTGCKIIDVVKRYDWPCQRHYSPMFYTKDSKENRGTQYNSNPPPTVKGMQKAHHRSLVLKRTCLNNRTAKYLRQSTPYSINNNTCKYSMKWNR